VVRSLYHLGADIDHRNHAGQSATALAAEINDANFVATMKEFVAEDTIPEGMRGFPLGGIFELGDTLVGRLSIPAKIRPVRQ